MRTVEQFEARLLTRGKCSLYKPWEDSEFGGFGGGWGGGVGSAGGFGADPITGGMNEGEIWASLRYTPVSDARGQLALRNAQRDRLRQWLKVGGGNDALSTSGEKSSSSVRPSSTTATITNAVKSVPVWAWVVLLVLFLLPGGRRRR